MGMRRNSEPENSSWLQLMNTSVATIGRGYRWKFALNH